MSWDTAITCKHASTFWANGELYILCKLYKKACESVVAENLCEGKHKKEENIEILQS